MPLLGHRHTQARRDPASYCLCGRIVPMSGAANPALVTPVAQTSAAVPSCRACPSVPPMRLTPIFCSPCAHQAYAPRPCTTLAGPQLTLHVCPAASRQRRTRRTPAARPARRPWAPARAPRLAGSLMGGSRGQDVVTLIGTGPCDTTQTAPLCLMRCAPLMRDSAGHGTTRATGAG
jgi:hypothetical protein